MASITVVEFRARFSRTDFNDSSLYPDAVIQLAINDTECEMDESQWGCFFAKGQAFLAAHYLAIDDILAKGSGTDGGQSTLKAIASETEGDTSVSYVTGNSANGIMSGAGKDDLLASTLYGQQYIELRSKAIIGIASSGSNVGAIARQSRSTILPTL